MLFVNFIFQEHVQAAQTRVEQLGEDRSKLAAQLADVNSQLRSAQVYYYDVD